MNGEQTSGQQQIQVDIGGLDNLECESCKNTLFQPVYMMKKVPATHPANNTGQEGIIPIQAAFGCVRCGHINKEFLPDQEANEISEEGENGQTPDDGIISTNLKIEN